MRLELKSLLSESAPILMGILNVTPDSFSDGGQFYDAQLAATQANELALGGAQIIDLGGEATGPGATRISAEEEIRRLSPVLESLASRYVVSVDTYKSQTAEHALQRGVQIINDISALRADKDLGAVIKNHHSYIVLMHSKESGEHPHVSNSARVYRDIVGEIADFLQKRVEHALSLGISQYKIILDPGMGRFLSNNGDDSWELLRHLDRLIEKLHPFPLLIGTSRKGFLGGELGQRDAISQLTGLHSILRGAKIIRTHNPLMMRQFLDVWSKITIP